MIQDIAPHKLHNPYHPEERASLSDKVMIIAGAKVLVKHEVPIVFPTLQEVVDMGCFSMEEKDSCLTYLFALDEEKFFLYGVEQQTESAHKDKVASMEKDGFVFKDLRELREKEAYGPTEQILVAYTAKHLSDWYRDNAFCGRCGEKTGHSKTERARVCPSCGNTVYPRIMPAVIVGVTNGEKILITRYNRGFAHNALVAGFVEIGETLEETVAREVMEEAGVKVRNIRYYKSQPWGSANDLLAGFYCDVDGDDTVHRDDNELKYAEWTKREDIVLQPDSLSLTNEMMKMFKEGKNN